MKTRSRFALFILVLLIVLQIATANQLDEAQFIVVIPSDAPSSVDTLAASFINEREMSVETEFIKATDREVYRSITMTEAANKSFVMIDNDRKEVIVVVGEQVPTDEFVKLTGVDIYFCQRGFHVIATIQGIPYNGAISVWNEETYRVDLLAGGEHDYALPFPIGHQFTREDFLLGEATEEGEPIEEPDDAEETGEEVIVGKDMTIPCEGCRNLNECIPIGDTIVIGNQTLYCSPERALFRTKASGEGCLGGYACDAGQCIDGRCSDGETTPPPPEPSIIKKIWNWFVDLW